MPAISIILDTNTQLYNYLNDLNYEMSKSQFNHLSIIVSGLINIRCNKTIFQIAKNILSAKHKSYIYRFLSHSNSDNSLLDRNRINYLNHSVKNNVADSSVGFLVIDDTVNVKKSAKEMQSLSFNHFYNEDKRV